MTSIRIPRIDTDGKCGCRCMVYAAVKASRTPVLHLGVRLDRAEVVREPKLSIGESKRNLALEVVFGVARSSLVPE